MRLVNFFALFSFVVHHKQFKVVASVENKKVVDGAFFCSFFETFFCDIKQRFGNNMVTS